MTTEETQVRRDLIAQLFGAFGKAPTEANYAGYEAALKLMATPTLARVISTWLERVSEATEPEELRVPTAGKLWQLRRKLRALPQPLELKAAEPKFLPFDTNANQLLMQYIWDAHAAKSVARYAPDSPNPREPGPSTRQRTAILVKWKNEWAREMREDRELYGGKRDGKQLWVEYMAEAEAELDRHIALKTAAA